MRGRLTNWDAMPEVTAYIREVCRGRLTAETTVLVNRRFGTSFRQTQIKAYMHNHGLTTGLGKAKKGVARRWHPEVDGRLRELKDLPDAEIARLLGEEFPGEFTACSVSDRKCRLGIHSVNDGRFGPGFIGGNRFQKGNIPVGWKPVGTESVREDGFVWVKVKDERYAPQRECWKQKHRLLWEEANGPIPEGMVVTFRDGDRSNFSLDNLRLVSMEENAILTVWGVRNMDESIRATGEAAARLVAEAKRRRKKNGSDDERAEHDPVRAD